MITFDIIRGHKLILWANRLNFQQDFIERLDKYGTNYVQEIEQMGDGYSLIVYAKLRDSYAPFPILFNCTEIQLNSLVEKVQVAEGVK